MFLNNPVFWLAAWVAALGLVPAAARADSDTFDGWNFTHEDYRALVRRGGQLRFASDSDWFPKELRANLKATLDYALDPALSPSVTDGINAKDFYHGHIGCDDESRAVRREIGQEVEQALKLEDKVFADRGFEHDYLGDTAEATDTVRRYGEAVKAGETVFGEMLERLIRRKLCKRLLVVYHTYEAHHPADGVLRNHDPRRNIVTYDDKLKPIGFRPPELDNASSWTDLFANVMQFAFLVDREGVIHVTFGTTHQLARVTGYQMGIARQGQGQSQD
jgi:hypothetical protein